MAGLSDYELALQLQNELNGGSGDSVPAKKQKKDHTSIVDSEWEKLDPNPDVYALFQTFDKKFFWSALQSVEVKWSKRMYSCAGICYYKGKRGGCCISLSLPLLQLRPRKDLVETLLHEMIHAYLFLTANKQDREEHGPLFHEHMNRINKAAGTKITVYHSFHDEVAHYKQHWWRCNGPCQSRKPFFGLVKRAMNRAPGPHDFWYAEHQSSCGGEFIKIKEPENFKARKSRVKNKDDSSSLNKYIPSNPETLSSTKSTETDKNRKKPVKKNETGKSNKPSSNVSSLTNYFSSTSSSHNSDSKSSNSNKPSVSSDIKKTETNNIHGFSSLKSESPSTSTASTGKVNTVIPNKSGSGTGLKSNKGGTLVMNPRPGSSVNSNENSDSPVKEKIIPFSGTGHVLAPGAVADRSRSVLLSLFDKKNSDSSGKTVEKKINEKEIKRQESLKNKTEERKSSKPVNKSSFEDKKNEKDTNKCFDSQQRGRSTVLKTKTNENYSSPSKKVSQGRPNDGSSTSKEYGKEPSVSGTEVKKLPVKKEIQDEPVVITSDSDDDITEDIDLVVNCPVCGFQTIGSLINEHLDECSGFNTVLENVQIIDEETEFDLASQVQCPSCGIMCLEDDINAHLDACLS